MGVKLSKIDKNTFDSFYFSGFFFFFFHEKAVGLLMGWC